MKNNRPPFRAAIGTGLKAFYAALPQIAVFEIVYKLASALVTKPLLSVLTQILLQIGGNELAFNEKIWHFIFSIPGILAVVLLVGLASVLIYFEFAVIITLAQQALQQEKPSLKTAIPKALWCFGSIKSPSALLFALYALLLLPLVNMGITSSLLPALTVPNFITGELAKTPVGEWALLAAAAIVVVVFFCLLFVLPSMVIEHCRFGSATKKASGPSGPTASQSWACCWYLARLGCCCSNCPVFCSISFSGCQASASSRPSLIWGCPSAHRWFCLYGWWQPPRNTL